MRFSGAAPFESALYDTLRSRVLGSIRAKRASRDGDRLELSPPSVPAINLPRLTSLVLG